MNEYKMNPHVKAIDALLDAIDDAADGQEAWLEYGPYRLILQRAKELRAIVPGLKESYEPAIDREQIIEIDEDGKVHGDISGIKRDG